MPNVSRFSSIAFDDNECGIGLVNIHVQIYFSGRWKRHRGPILRARARDGRKRSLEMKEGNPMKAPVFSVTVLAAMALCLPLKGHETAEKSPDPGFRPECEKASTFIADVKTATVQVHPSIVRTPTNTTFSTKSQQQVVAFLNAEKITKAVPDKMEFDVGEIKGRGQFDWFQNDMETIGREVKSLEAEADYILVMEVLFPPERGNRQSVFGIHCMILDTEGQNVFSFLLNSHHRMFADAQMQGEGDAGPVRDALVEQATAVILSALVQQIENANSGP
jgi:hypothetical protein